MPTFTDAGYRRVAMTGVLQLIPLIPQCEIQAGTRLNLPGCGARLKLRFSKLPFEMYWLSYVALSPVNH